MEPSAVPNQDVNKLNWSSDMVNVSSSLMLTINMGHTRKSKDNILHRTSLCIKH